MPATVCSHMLFHIATYAMIPACACSCNRLDHVDPTASLLAALQNEVKLDEYQK
jgi:hypothetical protein